MIKVNLLNAIRENAGSSGGTGRESAEAGGFFARLFSAKSSSGELIEPNLDDDFGDSTAQIVAKTLIMGLIVGGLVYHESVNIPRLKGELESENTKYQELVEYNNNASAVVAEIVRLKEQKKLIEKQIASLDTLSKARFRYVRALEFIQTSIPEKMWFLELRTQESLIEAVGLAYTEGEITQFLDVVGKSALFSDVSLVSSEDNTEGPLNTKNFKRFTITFALEVEK